MTVPEVDPRPEDVATIDGIVAAFYEVVSGPVGQPRDWGRDATLYMEPMSVHDRRGRFRRKSRRAHDLQGNSTSTIRTPSSSNRASPSGRSIARRAEFGNIAHVWSTYEWTTADGRTGRGINGIDLFHDGTRWWITHATWDYEREAESGPGGVSAVRTRAR